MVKIKNIQTPQGKNNARSGRTFYKCGRSTRVQALLDPEISQVSLSALEFIEDMLGGGGHWS